MKFSFPQISIPKMPLHDSNVVQGVSARWFLRHFVVIIVAVFVAMTYISVRYDCITAMETVAHLKKRLQITRTEAQRERSMYMSATCESAMQELVDTMHLGLHIQECPPYTLHMPNPTQQ